MELTKKTLRDALSANVSAIRERISRAAALAGRDPAAVRLVAVTKDYPVEVIPELLALGIDAIGENRAEMIWKKDSALQRTVPWHMIGHFQRNKIAKSLELLHMVHSVHSMDLLGILDARRTPPEDPARRLPILLQVNVSGEPTKQGFSIEEAKHAADIAESLTRVKFSGLMTMAPLEATTDQIHDVFGKLRTLAESIGRDRARELSMGMSTDFEIAVREGATLVRIGSAIFGGIDFGR